MFAKRTLANPAHMIFWAIRTSTIQYMYGNHTGKEHVKRCMYLLSIPMHTLMSRISLTWLYFLRKASLGCFHWGLRWSRPASQNGNYKSFVIASERHGPWSQIHEKCKMETGRFGRCMAYILDFFWNMLTVDLTVDAFFEHLDMLAHFELFWELWNTLRLLWTQHSGSIVLDSKSWNHTIEKSILKKTVFVRDAYFIEKTPFQRFNCSGCPFWKWEVIDRADRTMFGSTTTIGHRLRFQAVGLIFSEKELDFIGFFHKLA